MTIIVEHFSNIMFSCIVQEDTGTQCSDLLILSGVLLLLFLYSVYLGLERVLDLRYRGDKDLCLEHDLFLGIDLGFLCNVLENDPSLLSDLLVDFDKDLVLLRVCDLVFKLD